MILLYWLALFLFAIFGVVNFVYLWISEWKFPKGYFKQTAINIDRFGNSEFKALWNGLLITKEGHKFGNINETISGVLGENYYTDTLTNYGKVTVFLLSPNHCIRANGLPVTKEKLRNKIIRLLAWCVFPLLYVFATAQSIRIALWGVLAATFGKLCNLHIDENIFYYLGIVFVLLFSLELLIWIGKKIR